MSVSKSKANSLESLIRTALFNAELTPGVAKQIGLYRAELSNGSERRLLAILDDAIESGAITVIDLDHKPAVLQPLSCRLHSMAA